MTEAHEVERLAAELFAAHLPGTRWRFAFDNARRRAGACDYARHRITVSRHLAARCGLEEVRQVLLHEIAHALAGSGAAHGPRWRTVGRRIGYTGSRLHQGPIADDQAPWVGRCPAGHTHYRFRTPTAPLSCGVCGRGFSSARLITWERRSVGTAARA